MNEFERIKTFFAPLAGPEGLGLLDDAAVLETPAGSDIVTTKDILVEGVHVPMGAVPEVFARRALRTNLSDLAAMAAYPLGYLLGLALPPETPDAWLEGFARALGEDQKLFDVSLWGGDSVRTTGPIIVSVTAIGSVLEYSALKRSGAQRGDGLYVSGSIGRAAAGLQMALGSLDNGSPNWLEAYERPVPRLRLGQVLRGVATACADVSDGLLADAGHIAKASGLTAHIDLARVPMDADLPLDAMSAVTAGDDYELVFTVPPSKEETVFTLSESLGITLTNIGEMRLPTKAASGESVIVKDLAGMPLKVGRKGWLHQG